MVVVEILMLMTAAAPFRHSLTSYRSSSDVRPCFEIVVVVVVVVVAAAAAVVVVVMVVVEILMLMTATAPSRSSLMSCRASPDVNRLFEMVVIVAVAVVVVVVVWWLW